jgi:hypothetical protein
MSAKKSANVSSLLAAIQRQVPTAAPDPVKEAVKETPAVPTLASEKKTKASGTRKAAHKLQFYLHDEDRRTIRELSAWLAGQGVRASDSLIIRSALRLTKTGSDLLSTYRQLAELDGRIKRIE